MHLLASIGTAGRTTLASSSGALVDWLNGDWGYFSFNSYYGNTIFNLFMVY